MTAVDCVEARHSRQNEVPVLTYVVRNASPLPLLGFYRPTSFPIDISDALRIFCRIRIQNVSRDTTIRFTIQIVGPGSPDSL